MSTPPGLTDNREPIPLDIAPGFFSEGTPRTAKNHWKDGNRVRFKNGMPQKMGGWEARALTGATYRGITRRFHEWVALDGGRWIAEGTSKKLYVINGDQRFDITPVRRDLTLGNNPFATTNLSTTVVVTDTAHGAAAGDFVRFSGATAVAGITISGEYEITEIVDNNSYKIVHSVAANATTTGGGAAVVAKYDISSGNDTAVAGLGYGAGLYGMETYGTPRSSGVSTIVQRLRTWSLDNFGEDLIASPSGGAVYHWDKSAGTGNRAVILSNAPSTNERVLISPSGGRIICLGAYDTIATASDPLNIVVGEEESLTGFDVAPGLGESADVFNDRATNGSRLITGVNARGGTLLFTDTALYFLLPDPVEIFQLQPLTTGNTVIGPNAAVEVDGRVYVMAANKFMVFDGVYTELPCTVWGHVFTTNGGAPGINLAQGDKVYGWHNELFSEIWWHYPSAGSDENSHTVIYNYSEQLWYYMSLNRTAALRKGPTYNVPVAINSGGTFVLHETGVNAGNSPMGEYIESYDAEIQSGKSQMHISKIIPDMVQQTGTLQLLIRAKKRPQDTSYREKGPYNLEPGQNKKSVRAKGRQVALRVSSNVTGTDWRMGPFQAYITEDGEEGE